MATSERFVDALNAQISKEFYAAHQYTAIAAWYSGETYPRLAAFFYDQASEEREHALKMVNYLLDRGEKVGFKEVGQPKSEFPDWIAPLRLALEQEQGVTVAISELQGIARETNDFVSEQFIHWFLDEQVEEEASMQDLIDVAERCREVPMLLEEYLARETPGEKG